MFDSNRTKIAFANALIDLMKDTPFDKISTSSIISACGASRRTFYYHFKDKQDLICWYFDWDISTALGTSDIVIDNEGRRKPFVNALLHYMYSQREIYANALSSTAQNSLRSHLFDFIYQYRRQQIIALLNGRHMDPLGIKFLAEYFTNAIIGIILNWAEDGMSYPPERFDSGYYNVTTVCMQAVVDKFSEETAPFGAERYIDK